MEKGQRVYITVPPELAEKAALLSAGPFSDSCSDAFSIDPSTPLPVELPPGETAFSPETLSVEMILSGILRELADNSGGEHAAYYRALAAALRPDLRAELTGAALAKSDNGDHEGALEIAALLEGLCPRHPAVLLARARICGAVENTREDRTAKDTGSCAEAAWEAALASPLPGTLFFAGLYYYDRGEYRRSAELLSLYHEGTGEDEAEESSSDSEQREKAWELLEEIRRDGLDDEAFLEACSLVRDEKEEQGILKARDFLERRPTSAKGWFVLGWGLRRLARWEDGAACFEKAAALGLNNADTKNELALCLIETGRYDHAQRELESALRQDPSSVKIISNLGVLALRQGRGAEAKAFFRTALEKDPNDPVALAFMPR
jgi:tetratricopeptide (TPR) repeat protein